MTMKRARWGASHVIHEQFSDGFPELADRYVGERQAAERRYEYNLGCRRFDDVMRAEAGITMLKRLFRTLDQAVAVDMTLAQVRRYDTCASLVSTRGVAKIHACTNSLASASMDSSVCPQLGWTLRR